MPKETVEVRETKPENITISVDASGKIYWNDLYIGSTAALIERLFRSLHLALARVPGSLAVATIVTCAIFATATGIVGAVVTLMGLLALPPMLRAGYNVKLAAGSITAGAERNAYW